MKIIYLMIATVVAIVAPLQLAAQNVGGVVKDDSGEALMGATVWWADTSVGTAATTDGTFSLHRVKGYDRLVAGFVGMRNDTLTVKSGVERVEFKLSSNAQLESVIVDGTLNANYIKLNSIAKDEVISFAGLCKMACCNLAESFENSASVTVGYSDAISGARQIQMLGLEGTYTQMLDENRPMMMGLGSAYGLSYTPGMWLNSIQVSKGISSVVSGHEAITGQINLEHRKPTDNERLFLNLYLNSELKPEANLSTAFPVSKNKKLSSVILVHASADNEIMHVDCNDDGFRDHPLSRQLSMANRWSYLADNGLQLRWGFKIVDDSRLGGSIDYDEDDRATMYADNLYGSKIENRGMNGYLKVGKPVGMAVYDPKSGDELRSNIAFVVDYDYFKEDAYFGLNDYLGVDKRVFANAMYNHYLSSCSSFIVGVMGHITDVDETLSNNAPWLSITNKTYDLSRQENEVGIYGEYTFKLDEKLSFIAGVRGDYNDLYDDTFVTPRGQFKWSITPTTTLRFSGGTGYRTANLVTDNIGIMATGREIIIEDNIDRREYATTLGGSLTQQFKILKKGDAMISFDYFRTQFSQRVIADYEWDGESIHLYNTDEQSSTDSYQVDLTWSPIGGFDIFATFRYTNSKMTFDRPDGSTYTTEQPLISRYKTLLNLQYATPMRKWVFDVTAQVNGPTRMPSQTGDIYNAEYSPAYPMVFAQVSRRFGAWEVYAGCENITNYTQEEAIISADEPFSSAFNSAAVWGPLMGRKYYVGLRFNLY
ncbi:MAG: TonB-dependent receptor [Rikenellaceae bacterium]